MRTIHWLFVVSVLLFVSGLGFLIAGARTSSPDQPAESVVAVGTPVASVKQIMIAISQPSATVIFEAVGSTVTASGTVEKAPQTDAEWEAVGSSAAALIESGNLILTAGRAVDQQDWVNNTQLMIDAGKAALQAARAKNADGILASGADLYDSCDSCHAKYRRTF